MNHFSFSFPIIVVLGGVIAAGCGQAAPKEHAAAQSSADTVDPTSAFYDSTTQCTVNGTRMHCCPTGSAMIGAQVSQNVFKCAWLFDQSGDIILDTRTQRNNMHSCPLGRVMVGLRADLNRLACQSIPSQPVVAEAVDTGTYDGYPMHVCPQNSGAASMTGIRIDQDKLNCGVNDQLEPAPGCLLGSCLDPNCANFFLDKAGVCTDNNCCVLG